MEIFATRQEIRRRVMARMGWTTNGSQAPLNLDQLNESIRAAALEVYGRCQWVRTLRETTAEVGIDQRFINYPDACGPGELVAIALWDADAQRYRPLRRGRIRPHQDDEPLVEEGEPASVPGRARPTMYEAKNQIELWPRADQVYRLKIDHQVSPDLGTDDAVSVVDAELIILWVMGDAFELQGDGDLAATQRGKFETRVRKLIADASPRESLMMGARDRIGLNQGIGYQPTSGQWPAVMPEDG